MTGVGADHKVITGASERTLNQTQGRQERYEAHNGPDTFDMLLALSYVPVSPVMFRPAKENADSSPVLF